MFSYNCIVLGDTSLCSTTSFKWWQKKAVVWFVCTNLNKPNSHDTIQTSTQMKITKHNHQQRTWTCYPLYSYAAKKLCKEQKCFL